MDLKYLGFALVPIILGAVFTSIKKSNAKELLSCENKDHVVIHLPKAAAWIGIICTLCFLGMLILMIAIPNETSSLGVGIVFIIFILVGLLLTIAALVWKIYIFKDKEYLIYITFFGRSYKFFYSDISYKVTNRSIHIKVGKKTFFVDKEASNIEVLLNMFKKHKVKNDTK